MLQMKSLRNTWNRIADTYPWHFMGFLLLAMLIPKIYDLTDTYWIGKISYSALAITEQYEFIAVTIEIVNETIPFGVLALVAQNYKNREKIVSILKAGILIQLIFSLSLTAIVVGFTPQFVSAVGTPTEIVALTTKYLILKSLALPFDSIAIILLVAIKAMRKGREALYLALSSVLLNIVLDLLLISNMNFSQKLGVEGVAIGYIISKLTLAVLSLAFIMRLLGTRNTGSTSDSWREKIKPLFSIGGWTGLDSLVRNVGYILVPLSVLNFIGTAPFGGYGLAMTVMWTLIIPVLAITEGTNVVVGNNFGERKITEIKKTLMTSLVLVLIVMAFISVGGLFYWNNFSSFFNMNPDIVTYSVETFKWLIIPYCCFATGMVLRSVFLGTGKTYYILAISCLQNFLLIFPYWALSKTGIITTDFNNTMALFVIVFLADPILSYIFARRTLKRETLKAKV
jgi:Na+-driven multidrug efflux pump